MHNQSQESAHPSAPTPLSVYFILGFQLAVVVASVWDAFQHRWLSDDAFISFRYAKHWSEGHGLVYNIGEWVEGYTNLLWQKGEELMVRHGTVIPQYAFHTWG